MLNKFSPKSWFMIIKYMQFFYISTTTSPVNPSYNSDGALAPTGDYNNVGLQPGDNTTTMPPVDPSQPGWSLGSHWMATTTAWPPVDPGQPGWSLDSCWTATTLQPLTTRAMTRMEPCLPSENTASQVIPSSRNLRLRLHYRPQLTRAIT